LGFSHFSEKIKIFFCKKGNFFHVVVFIIIQGVNKKGKKRKGYLKGFTFLNLFNFKLYLVYLVYF